MGCPQHIQLINIAEAARNELRHNHNEISVADSGLLTSSGWERALRTTIFTAEIDAAYHKARCSQCQGLVRVEPESGTLDQMAA